MWIWKCRQTSSFSWVKILLRCKLSGVPSCWHRTSQLLEQQGGIWTYQMVWQVHHLVFGQYEMTGMLQRIPWLKQNCKADLYVPGTVLDLSLMSPIWYHQKKVYKQVQICSKICNGNTSFEVMDRITSCKKSATPFLSGHLKPRDSKNSRTFSHGPW